MHDEEAAVCFMKPQCSAVNKCQSMFSLSGSGLERSGAEPMSALSADSLEDVAREAEATPGLQQLARVLPVQLQVLYGADDL